MMTPTSSSALHRAILQAWECAFADTPVTYLSGPITSGPRHVERLRRGTAVGLTKDTVIQENCKEMRTTAARLRRERGDIVVEPASLNIMNWSQQEYISLWGAFIERHVKLIIFMPGWEYSVGSTLEFARAHMHDVRTETVSGSLITIDDALALINIALENVQTEVGSHQQELNALADKLKSVISRLDALRRPRNAAMNQALRKDESLEVLARTMNVAQFVSFSPFGGQPKQEYARLAGYSPNPTFPDVRCAIETLLRASSEQSINVRSYAPFSSQSREFIYGLTNVSDAVAAVERLSQEGLHTIVNETIDVNDGGVSGVLMGDVLEFAPDDTPRCVEKPDAASLPRGWGRELLGTVYGFPVALDVPLASRLEFSIHPRPRGWKRSNILAWEFAEQPYVSVRPKPSWPNRFSKLIGDKTFGLLVGHHIGLPVPFTTVICRRVAPFSFGRPTCSGESWIRTAPIEQVPGRFATNHGWLDPFNLLMTEDPLGISIMSVLSQQGVFQFYSGALIVGGDGNLIIEGKSGEGESLMLGVSVPEELPRQVQMDIRALYARAEAVLGAVRFEWVHDGERAWIVQLHSGVTDTIQDDITNRTAERWQTFDVRLGLDELRKAVAALPVDTGIILSRRLGLTSHFADVLRRANVPARMGSSSASD
jgi:hypothetical protein